MSNFISKALIAVCLTAALTGCQEKKTTVSETTEEITDYLEAIPSPWIDGRVEKAKARLNTTPSGQVIWKSMEAHGGLKNWYSQGPLGFRFNYQPLDGSVQRDSYQVVDVWRNRSIHHSISDSTSQYGWTGSEAWVMAKDSTVFQYDTKFWALTPLYLMGFPFVLDGEGVHLELLPQSNYQGKTNDVVKVTFAPGTGDAPDDYYILHFDTETHLLIGTRYIVSYPEYFKDGGHLPEKFMEVGPLVDVSGILLPSELKTHWTVDGLPGEYLTHIEISNMGFKGSLPQEYFEMPEGAKKL